MKKYDISVRKSYNIYSIQNKGFYLLFDKVLTNMTELYICGIIYSGVFIKFASILTAKDGKIAVASWIITMEKFQGTVFEKLGNISATTIMQINPCEAERDLFFEALDYWIRKEALPNRIKPQLGLAGGVLYPCSNIQDFFNSLPSKEPITELNLKITDEGKRITFAYTSNTNLTFEYLVVLK